MDIHLLPTELGLISVDPGDLPFGIASMSAWMETPGRFCVRVHVSGLNEAEVEIFPTLAAAVAKYSVLAWYLIDVFPVPAE